MDRRTTTAWAGLLLPKGKRGLRSDRHRTHRTWRKWLGVVSKATLGLLLVGCTTLPFSRRNEPIDPIATLQSSTQGNDRIEAYRKLARWEELTPEQQSAGRQLLMKGAESEYNLLARTAALAGLVHCKDAEATQVLLKAATDKSSVVRLEACQALKERNDPKVRATLKELLATDNDPDVRIAATRTLASTKDKEVVPILIEALKDGELAVAHHAAEGLREITGAPVTTDKYADWTSWADGKPRPTTAVEQTAQKSFISNMLDVFRR